MKDRDGEIFELEFLSIPFDRTKVRVIKTHF